MTHARTSRPCDPPPARHRRVRVLALVGLLACGGALTLGAAPALAADRVTVGEVVLVGDGLDVTVGYRCASPFGYDSLRVSATDSSRGGVFEGTLEPHCDGSARRAVVHASRVAGPASLPGHEALVTASLGTDSGGLLFSPAVRGSGTRVLQPQAG